MYASCQKPFLANTVSGCASWGYSRWTEENDVTCYINDDFTSPVYRDTRVNNPENRQWMWMLCNEPYVLLFSALPSFHSVIDKLWPTDSSFGVLAARPRISLPWPASS